MSDIITWRANLVRDFGFTSIAAPTSVDYHVGRESAPFPGTSGIFSFDLFPQVVMRALKEKRPVAITECATLGKRVVIDDSDAALCTTQSILAWWQRHPDIYKANAYPVAYERAILSERVKTIQVVGLWRPDEHRLIVLDAYVQRTRKILKNAGSSVALWAAAYLGE